MKSDNIMKAYFFPRNASIKVFFPGSDVPLSGRSLNQFVMGDTYWVLITKNPEANGKPAWKRWVNLSLAEQVIVEEEDS